MIALTQPSCHNRLKSLNSFSVSLLVRQDGRLSEKRIVVDLLDQEIGDIGARDETASPVFPIDQCAVGAGSRSIRQDNRASNHPFERALADNLLLHVLVVVGTPEKEVKCRVVEKSALVAAVARAEAGQTDQPLDPGLFHRSDENARCL